MGVRPGAESRAERKWGLQGSWESLLSPRTKPGLDHTGVSRSRISSEAFGSGSPRKRRQPEVSKAERKAKAREMGRGSLSIFIVALESRETVPREPVSSQGGCQTHFSLLPHARSVCQIGFIDRLFSPPSAGVYHMGVWKFLKEVTGKFS